MTTYGIITTLASGFIFPFIIAMVWGHYVDKHKIFGGVVVAGMVVGTMWMVNHGVGFIVQGTDAPWVDQAWAAGVGLLAFGFAKKASFKKTFPTLLFSILGGVVAGYIVSVLGK
ncbi:MAG: hypothetical protein N4A63_14790 [Vallitalea sp.]|jgi:hypothetical protein|nr:hypothetical protein [Vallitalea sp.]